ncbi:ABC transporter permease [bacterium]|nr:ABC transporter permease [bacterium]
MKSLLKYILKRGLSLFLTVVVAVYLTIIIANAGGYVDKIVETELMTNIVMRLKEDPTFRNLSEEQQKELIESRFKHEMKRRGLDLPFPIRSMYHLRDAIVLNLGRAMYMTSDSGSALVRNIILERLPVTVLLFTTATVANFFLHLFLGLRLSRKYGSFWDKLIIALSPTSVIPGWFYGIFLIMIFYSWLHILPGGGLVDYPPPSGTIPYFLSVLKHMILPLSSWIIASLFLGIYQERTFFLIYSTEDYVEVAKAKGLTSRQIENRYLLRPALPPVITGFALSVISSWTGAIVTEAVFNWPGLGQVISQAISYFDAPVIVGVTVVYAYLLAITVLALDIIYAVVDPRMRIQG